MAFVFYETRGLSLAAGSADLITGHPSSSEDMDNFVKWFKKTFLIVMRKERTRKNVHLLTNDAQSLLQELLPEQSSWGVFDPFDAIYEIIYQLTIRMVGPTEIAQDAKLRAKSLTLLESIEHSKSTMRVVFPWLPTIMHLRRTLRNIQFGMLLHGLIRKRQKSGIREDDTMQTLLDMGTSMRNTIGFVIGALFAGQLNTGINAAWVLVKLAQNDQWTARVRNEVDAIAVRYRKYHGQPTTEVLGTLTLDDWESEFPNIGLCFHESIRLALTGSSFRKNISGQDIPIGNSGEVIPRDAYAAYLHDELHMNPDVYPNPTEFDPGRHLDERGEGKNVPHSYIGWGSAVMHPD
ncbi:Cytochrome monooxygenase claM like protein [Verticillium longisporum]|uniref:Cytochrome monooxygenase claM like protein n=1 Tax=Verticillium longisporum TaxID=100787 RepID=A0A8I2Z131_VERLO|nr:Cytochrome monooxygenase claM like protein [Verticillium longisporum]